MHQSTDALTRSSPSSTSADAASSEWTRPAFQVISLDCEITAYAPDGEDEPLF